MRFFEDIQLDRVSESPATYTLDRDNIIGFCGEWDPMPFHVDEDYARQTPMGRLFTSAAHLVSISLKLAHSISNEPSATIAGLGWDEVRFHRPGFVGDTLRVRSSVVEKRESRSNPDRGIATALIQLLNQDDELVASYRISTLVMRRPRE